MQLIAHKILYLRIFANDIFTFNARNLERQASIVQNIFIVTTRRIYRIRLCLASLVKLVSRFIAASVK